MHFNPQTTCFIPSITFDLITIHTLMFFTKHTFNSTLFSLHSNNNSVLQPPYYVLHHSTAGHHQHSAIFPLHQLQPRSICSTTRHSLLYFHHRPHTPPPSTPPSPLHANILIHLITTNASHLTWFHSSCNRLQTTEFNRICLLTASQATCCLELTQSNSVRFVLTELGGA